MVCNILHTIYINHRLYININLPNNEKQKRAKPALITPHMQLRRRNRNDYFFLLSPRNIYIQLLSSAENVFVAISQFTHRTVLYNSSHNPGMTPVTRFMEQRIYLRSIAARVDHLRYLFIERVNKGFEYTIICRLRAFGIQTSEV